MNKAPKAGDKCPYCKEGTPVISPSGRYLICRKCGRVIVASSPKGQQQT
jgi:ribosomal protein S27E